MHAISSYHGNRPTPTHPQTGRITIHCRSWRGVKIDIQRQYDDMGVSHFVKVAESRFSDTCSPDSPSRGWLKPHCGTSEQAPKYHADAANNSGDIASAVRLNRPHSFVHVPQQIHVNISISFHLLYPAVSITSSRILFHRIILSRPTSRLFINKGRFLPRDAMRKRGLCSRPCPSVCPSVTFVYCIRIAEDIVKLLSQPGSPIILVFYPQRPYPILRGTPLVGAQNTRGRENLSRKRYEIGPWLWNVNRKS